MLYILYVVNMFNMIIILMQILFRYILNNLFGLPVPADIR